MPKTLVVIAGPTAVGKTDVAIKLARHLDTVVISADSRQFYKEMSIGTAKPTPQELAEVKHYFIDSHSVTHSFTVGAYEKQVLQLLDELFKMHDKVILAGGSGLFIKAVCEGFDDLPSAPPEIRQKLNEEFEEKGITYLQDRLKIADPDYYNEADLDNPRRLIRALEVFEVTGKPFSSFRMAAASPRPFNCIKIGLSLPRDILYERINRRVDVMIEQGLVDEARTLLNYRYYNALDTVGYAELFEYFDGKTDLQTAISLIKQNTRRFAKRQLTWFRRDPEIKWFDISQPEFLNRVLSVVDNT
ncbi:tRNA (adenosine(37)-N6)-dimethylallyltransferase MiaA [Mucilaginibacter hurinus]|uniref:tRNA dimethylallyltransferase n=1 Tax=Mucilaginibacter hurinus TaxID=2201324 RepID=A0A367GVR1_9SPHI|nr:tRNA (adenosine(37)-N6)-dimethylallyltransferase MiaA [Mucilaginibacter hurinus]RCH56901.1 tRNA (adenosine(37)-N6)-dimethylallyltransferase MiaA [Mucilaginibacter hurinus]